MEEPLLELKGVTFRHMVTAPTTFKPWRTRRGPGVMDVSFSLKPGEILGLVGPNGAGKTTLLRTIAGVLPVQDGSIHLGKVELDAPMSAADLRTIVGHMPEQVRWQGRQSVQDALLELAEMRGTSLKRVEGLLRLVGLADRCDTPLSGLSQGMRQRLTLAVALLGAPKVLLLDEPLNGLDPVAATAFVRLLHELTGKGVSIVISSHQVEGLAAITDRIALMHRGQILAIGTLDSIAESLELPSKIEVTGTGELPNLSWCEHAEKATIIDQNSWRVVLPETNENLLTDFVNRGIEVTSWNPRPPGIVEMLCAATGMDIDEVGLDIASAALLPHRRIGGEEE